MEDQKALSIDVAERHLCKVCGRVLKEKLAIKRGMGACCAAKKAAKLQPDMFEAKAQEQVWGLLLLDIPKLSYDEITKKYKVTLRE